MPWECKQCLATQPDDVATCVACGQDKASWTIEADATRAFVLTTSKLRALGCEPDREGALRVRLEVDDGDPVGADDRFTLFSPRGGFPALVKTAGEGEPQEGARVDLPFTGVDRGLAYSLEVLPADGEAYLAFDDVPYAELVRRAEPSAPRVPTWKAVDRIRAVDLGTLRDLTRQERPAPLERVVLVRSAGSAGKGATATVTVLFDTQVEQEVELPLVDVADGAGEVRLLLAFGPGGLDGVAFEGVHTIDVTEETDDGFAPKVQVSVPGQGKKSLAVEAPGGTLRVRLEIDPDDPIAEDDRFVLTCPRGEVQAQVRTVRDDLTPDDETTDLLFVGLDEESSYTLTVYPGGDERYTLFEDTPYPELIRRQT